MIRVKIINGPHEGRMYVTEKHVLEDGLLLGGDNDETFTYKLSSRVLGEFYFEWVQE